MRRSFSASSSDRDSAAGMDDPGAVLGGADVDGRLDAHLPAVLLGDVALELRNRVLADEAHRAAPEAGSREARAEAAFHRAGGSDENVQPARADLVVEAEALMGIVHQAPESGQVAG